MFVCSSLPLSDLTNCTLNVGAPQAPTPQPVPDAPSAPTTRGDRGDDDRPLLRDAEHMVGSTKEVTRRAVDGSSITARMSEYKAASTLGKSESPRRWEREWGDFGFGIRQRHRSLLNPGEFWCEEFGYYNLDPNNCIVDVQHGHELLRAFTAPPAPPILSPDPLPPPTNAWGEVDSHWGFPPSSFNYEYPTIAPPTRPAPQPPTTPSRPPSPQWDHTTRQWVDAQGWPLVYDQTRF